MRIPSLILASVVALILSGCNTFERRAEEKSEVFNSLDPTTRDRLKQRHLNVGDTQDMVYIALGAPDEKRDRLSSEGSETTWIYNAYWQQYEGTVLVGYRRHMVYDPRTKRYLVYYSPVRENVYSQREEERIRVTFRNNLVVSIEQAQ